MHVIISGEEKTAACCSIQEAARHDVKNVQGPVYMIALHVSCMPHFRDPCVNAILLILVRIVKLCRIKDRVTLCVSAVLVQILITVCNVSKMQKKTTMVSVYVARSTLVRIVRILPIDAMISASFVAALRLTNVECALIMQKWTWRGTVSVYLPGQETTARNLKEAASTHV